jgi:two-component system sensor histidine kinase MtrB
MLRTSSPGPILAHVRRTWRRSLQVRMVTITVATTAALMVVFGVVVGSLITNGLVAAQEASAKATVLENSADAVGRLERQVSDIEDPYYVPNVRSVVRELSRQDEVALAIHPEPVDGLPPEAQKPGVLVDAEGQATVPAPQLPADLRDAVRAYGFASQRRNLDIGEGTQLYLVFGRELRPSWGTVQVFYFFPLAGVVDQAQLVANTITITGFALVLVVGLVVFIVTRLVVRPVRLAARTAQRLSNGLLDQRMEVVGEDDLAALAASFNQMAETLQRHILRLEEMSRLQRRFTSDVSHELRTPLTTVRMAADLIFNSREDFDPAVARSAELLHAELDRFENLLSELLEISRFDAGFAVLEAEAANLAPLLSRVVERLAAVAERAGVRIHVDQPAEPVIAEVDVRRVERILRNLIGNAIEHGEGKPVKVRLAARDGAAAITVRDYGVGLRPGEEKLVFNRFWRADPSRARHTGGTGLGLSISVEDARLHGGWLEAWGAPGQGAQFRLTLPIRAGKKLVSSPLRLVPTDFRPPREALPEPTVRGPAGPAPTGAGASRRDLPPAVPARPPSARRPGAVPAGSSEGSPVEKGRP